MITKACSLLLEHDPTNLSLGELFVKTPINFWPLYFFLPESVLVSVNGGGNKLIHVEV